MTELQASIVILETDDCVSSSVRSQISHRVLAKGFEEIRSIHLNFSSRQSLYDFAKTLLQEALYGQSGVLEAYPLILPDGVPEIVNGARMDPDSWRVFVAYPKGDGVDPALMQI